LTEIYGWNIQRVFHVHCQTTDSGDKYINPSRKKNCTHTQNIKRGRKGGMGRIKDKRQKEAYGETAMMRLKRKISQKESKV
jgi:hypothetical protein